MDSSTTRYLPTYEDATGTYSLRLPTYRSSYIRRYHPYARYTTPIIQEQFMDEFDYDGPVLDLSILERRVDPVRLEPMNIEDANQGPSIPERPVEEQPPAFLVPMARAEAIDTDADGQEDLNEQPDQEIVFIRVHITPSS